MGIMNYSATIMPNRSPDISSLSMHGVRVDLVDLQQAVSVIEQFISEGGPHHVITLDSSMCVMAKDDPELSRIINSADLITPDSAGILWAVRRLGGALDERASGVEIVERLAERSGSKGYSLYFLGAGPGVAEAAAERMRDRYPGVRILGTHDGYFSTGDEEAIVSEIFALKPSVVCVALGIPKQEKLIARWQDRFGAAVLIGVGGTFDVLSGRVSRAPEWMQKYNLEWLYRVWRNPRKIGKVLMLPRFVWNTLVRSHAAPNLPQTSKTA